MTHPLTFVVLSTNQASFKELRQALATDSRIRLLAGGDDAEQLREEILRLRPQAAIITLPPQQPAAALKLVREIAAECPTTSVICASTDSSPDMILESLRAGAREFLRLPIIPQEFRTVIERTAATAVETVEPTQKRGRTIGVFSSKGGCGTSFIATNLAAALKSQTVLVDLNLQAGDLSLFLGLKPKFSIADLVENRSRIDDALLSTYLTPHSANLSLLAAPPEADAADDIEPEHVFETLELLRSRFDYVVVDPQHTFDAITLAALDGVDDLLMVVTLDIPAIRSAQRALQIFDRLGYPRHKIKVIVNRWSKQIELDVHEVERYLGEPVLGFVDSDYRTAVNSINLGQPLVDASPSSRIAVEIRRIATALTGVKESTPAASQARKGFLQRMLRRETAGTGAFASATLDKA